MEAGIQVAACLQGGITRSRNIGCERIDVGDADILATCSDLALEVVARICQGNIAGGRGELRGSDNRQRPMLGQIANNSNIKSAANDRGCLRGDLKACMADIQCHVACCGWQRNLHWIGHRRIVAQRQIGPGAAVCRIKYYRRIEQVGVVAQ